MEVCVTNDKSDNCSSVSDDFKLALSDDDNEKVSCDEDDLRLFLSDEEVPITNGEVEIRSDNMEPIEDQINIDDVKPILKEELIPMMMSEETPEVSKDHEELPSGKRLAENTEVGNSKKPRTEENPLTSEEPPAAVEDPVAQTPPSDKETESEVVASVREDSSPADDRVGTRTPSPEPVVTNVSDKTPEEIRQEAETKARKSKLRENVKKILNRDYKNLSKKDFEDLLVVSMMDYFRHYNPTIQLQKKVVMLERLVLKLKENYDRTVKQLYEAKYLIKRMIEMKKENPKGEMEIPFKLIRSVAVQVHSTRCRGGDLCPGVPSLPNNTKEVNGDMSNIVIKRSSRKSTNQRPVIKETEKTSNTAGGQSIVVNGGTPPLASPKQTILIPPPPSAPPPKPADAVAAQGSPAVASAKPQVPLPKTPSVKAAAVVIDLTSKDDPVENGSKDKLPPPPRQSPTVNFTSDLVKKMPGGSIPPGHKVVSIEKVQLPQLPTVPKYPPYTSRPPQPVLKVNKADQSGIMLSWTLKSNQPLSTEISSYQVYACQENCGIAREWSPVGDVKALPLPMACTLSQFREGHRYHFVVRAVDKHRVLGDFSHPASILLVKGVAPR